MDSKTEDNCNYSSSSDDETNFHDASNDSNEKIVEDLIEQQKNLFILNPEEENGKSPEKNQNNEQNYDDNNEKFVDCEGELIDDENQRENEKNLTEEEKLANKEKSDLIKADGNQAFKDGDYEKSIDLYTEGLKICPVDYNTERSILYGNRGAAKIKLDLKESAIDDCSKSIEFNTNYIKPYIRRAKLYEETDKLDESLEDYKKVLELEPGNSEARDAILRLPPKINERNEKLKEEMMGKLKDLGNMFLKPFGLSTNNFQMEQNPSTGSYSVNFKQN